MAESPQYTWLDLHINLDWLETSLQQLPHDDDGDERIWAIKQVRVLAEKMNGENLEPCRSVVEKLVARERNAGARRELTYLLQAVGVPPRTNPHVIDTVNRRALLAFLKRIGSVGSPGTELEFAL